MSSAEPWQTAEFSGPKKSAVITKPAMVRAVINRARHPVLLIGNRAASLDIVEKKFVDYLIDLALVHKIPVIATGHVNKLRGTGGIQAQSLCQLLKQASVLQILCGMGCTAGYLRSCHHRRHAVSDGMDTSFRSQARSSPYKNHFTR